MEVTNYFKKLYDIDVSGKVKSKGGNRYLSWAAAWASVKKEFPDATYKIYEQEFNIEETQENKTIRYTIGRPWFDDGKTCWVKTGVTINGIEHVEDLPVMDFKNKSLPVDQVTSADANKSIQRSLTKACARHGLGLFVYEGEDLPEELKEINKIQLEVRDLMLKKYKLSEQAAEKVTTLCKEADAEANGDPMLMEDLDTLKTLKKNLLAIRK